MIELAAATKLYGSVIGVNDVTVSLGPGAHGLLGPNGAGKSTFLNLLTGELRPTQGSVRVFGVHPNTGQQLRQRLGVCPGDEAFYGNVSGIDWVRYLLELHGFRAREALLKAAETLTLVGMRHAMHRKIGAYSRGMRQRTKLAQAIAHEPDLLILDEPFAGLDPVGRRSITDLLRNWVDGGRNLIMASHILHEVEAVTPSFLLICGGRLLASGTAGEIQRLLDELPTEIHIGCNQPRALAEKLVAESLVTALNFVDQETLSVSTRSPLALYNRLPEWSNLGEFEIYELRSETESLQAMFDSLMTVHRGGS